MFDGPPGACHATKNEPKNKAKTGPTKRAKINETLTGQSTTHISSQNISTPNTSTKNCEIVEIAYEIGQDDDEIERKDQLAEDPSTPNGVMSNRNKDATKVGKLTTFTVDGEIED